MDRKNKLTKLSKSFLLGASATILYSNLGTKTTNAMLRPLSKIPKIYQGILAGINKGSSPTSSTLRSTLGSSTINTHNSSTSLGNTPTNIPHTQNNNTTTSSIIQNTKSTPSSTGGIITSKSINSPGSGDLISSRTKFFETSSSNGSPSSSIPSTQVSTLRITFGKNNNTSSPKTNSTSNLSSSSSDPKSDNKNTNSLVGSFYGSSAQNSGTSNPQKVSELKKSFEHSGSNSTTTSKLPSSSSSSLAKSFGGKTTANKTNISNTTGTKSSTSQGTGNVSQLVAKFNGSYPKTTETPKEPTPTPPKVSELKKNFELPKTQPDTDSKKPINVSSLAKSFGGTIQQEKQKQQANENKSSVLSLVGNFEPNKSKTPKSLKTKKPDDGNVSQLVTKFNGTDPKTIETPKEPTPTPPKVSELRKNFELPKSESTPTPEPAPISVRNLAKNFEQSTEQQPESPSGKTVKTLARNFGGTKGGNKTHPRQLTYEEMIQ